MARATRFIAGPKTRPPADPLGDFFNRTSRPLSGYTCLHSDVPLLTSIQALGAVNSQFRALCGPWLWKTVHFPTSLPIPIDLWTEGILPREGLNVRSLSIKLASGIVLTPNDREPNAIDFDNIALDCNNFNRGRISPWNATKLLIQCPNLHELKVELDIETFTFDDHGVCAMGGMSQFNTFIVGISPLLSKMTALRHITWDGGAMGSTTESCLITMLKSLPWLESVSCKRLTRARKQQDEKQSLGFHLAQLKFLKKLSLYSVTSVDESWCLHSWPNHITHLEICWCREVSLKLAHQLIDRLAPNLTSLTLGIHEKDGHNEKLKPDDSAHSIQEPFVLPTLTALALRDESIHLLPLFRDCNRLNRLDCNISGEKHWALFQRVIDDLPWPQLQYLKLIRNIDRRSTIIIDEQDWKRMWELCLRKGIRLILHNDIGSIVRCIPTLGENL
ncbi:hypothetical protein CROQUDRAFT_35766 [Cronartium quercuum f. sp. fusiforme G11]|uniref:F-box domain-containing protein n=1 Tax=Cronartium quercuum f. sp. fusiforme G11 TaxID=708437 RepID=A0A9P6NUC3_9BASI|nr:hypothetical protein CROQUDRAFT_35766 [Cronartium quercuum f. sp. fusiforme G11]